MTSCIIRQVSKNEKNKLYRLFSTGSGGLLLIIFLFLRPGVSFGQQSPGNSDTTQGPPFIAQGQLLFLRHGTNSLIKMITIQIAHNEAERAEGLMWRRYMPEDDGMLFIFRNQEIQAFWMKNTYIPLDMVFADSTGKIVSIHANAVPFSEATISSGTPAQYVVEVNGGFCARYGVKEGDKIEFER